MKVRITFRSRCLVASLLVMIFINDAGVAGTVKNCPFPGLPALISADVTYLMYPARWFPVNDYTADRFTMDLKVTTPAGYRVLASGIDSTDQAPAGAVSTHYVCN